MAVRIITFGFKNGRPEHVNPDTDTVVDLRNWNFRNPWADLSLRGKTGLDKAVGRYIASGRGFNLEFSKLRLVVDSCVGTCFLGCMGGRHRSVFLGDKIASQKHISVYHRDLP